MDYQKMYEELKAENEIIRLRNDELSKMAYIMNTWCLNPNENKTETNVVNRLRSFCSGYSMRYIYGAGIKAERAVSTLAELDYQGFIVTKRKSVSMKFDHPIFELDEISEKLKNENCVLIVALNPQNTLEILPQLAEVKLNAVYFME